MRRPTDEILIRRYFLGDLPQEERVGVEDRYLADAEVFEEFLAIENDLIDSYVRGELAEDERQRFETEYFKLPLRRERVAFARSLNHISTLANQAVSPLTASRWKKVRTAISVPRPMPQWALAAAAVIIVASASWLMLQNQRLRVDLQQALARQAELHREEDTLREHIAQLEEGPKDHTQESQQGSEVAKLEMPQGPEVTLRLTPGIARGIGGRQNTLFLSTTASHLRLQLVLDRNEYSIYEAVLMTAERKEVLRGKALQSHSIGDDTVVTWRLPAQSLRSGDYIVQLTGQPATGSPEDVGSYSFRLLQK